MTLLPRSALYMYVWRGSFENVTFPPDFWRWYCAHVPIDPCPPDGDFGGFRLVHNFEIAAGRVTTLTLDLDAAASLHFTRGNGWMMRPSVQVIAATVEPVIRVTPEQLVELAALENASGVAMESRSATPSACRPTSPACGPTT